MVVSSKALDSLKAVGLNKYERNLWAALLARGSASAGELSDISNVPRSRCYDVLESLANRGFIVIQPGKPLKYVAVQPKEALERAKKKITEEAHEMSEKLDRLAKSDAVKELEKLHKENIRTMRPEDLTGALKGRYAMLQQAETMLKKARKSVKLLTTENGLVELAQNHGHLLKKASENGVKIQIAAPINKNNGDALKDIGRYAQIRNSQGIEKAEKLLGRLCVVDGQEFLLGLTDDVKTHPTQDVALWTKSDHVVSSLVEPMFDLVWHNSKPVK